MRRVSRCALARLWLSAVPIVLVACGGVDPDGTDGGVDVGDEEDPLDERDGGGNGGEGGPGRQSPAPPDTILIWVNDDEIRFPNSSANYHADFDNVVVTGDRLQGPEAESFSVAVASLSPGEFTCNTSHIVSYNARGEAGEPVFWTTRNEGGGCTITIDELGDVGGRVIGVFDAIIVNDSGAQVEVEGAFDVPRTADQ